MNSILQVKVSATGEWIDIPAIVGPQGPKGASGKNGTDGITPHIGANGNWFIGETDTEMPSHGEDAPQEAILYTPQALTPQQRAQARENIGAVGVSDLPSAETGGLTTAQINALDALFRAGAYTTDVSDEYTAFRKAFGLESGDEPDEPDIPVIATYSITNNLTGVVNSNDATVINEGESYSATLTIIEGYTWESVVITMGGVDITNTAYGDGYVTIYEVTGDIVITAIAILPAPVYELATALECDGTQEEVSTGIALLNDWEEPFTIMADYEIPRDGSFTPGYVFGSRRTGYKMVDSAALCLSTSRWWGNFSNNELFFQSTRFYMRNEDEGVYEVKLVLTRGAKKGTGNLYYMENNDGEKKTQTIGCSHNWIGSVQFDPLVLAAEGFKGTINRFKIYDRVVIEDEINEFLGV